MDVRSRIATRADIPVISSLYALLAEEMGALKAVWLLTDGLPEPIETALEALLDDPGIRVYIGEIARYPFGFLVARSEELLPQAGLIFTDPEAREVGIGAAMIDRFVADFRTSGHRCFDAHVPPGQREAKNFFESHGFSARRIVMHHPGG